MDRDDLKRQVQEATDIIQLIGEQVTLRPKGKEFAGLCPFHEDRNPSMFVSPQKQIYKCFVCGAGGDVFSFAMNYHKLSFPEALKVLGERAGIEVHDSHQQGEPGQPTVRQKLSEANKCACTFFQRQYQHEQAGAKVRDYVAKRGINTQMLEEFQIGYAPDSWDGLATYLQKRNMPIEDYIEAGLVSPRKTGGGLFDRMRHRLIFPICDALGRPIAFGGRILPDGTIDDKNEAKYLNSPETPLFNKSATLYGLHLAKQTILQTRTAVIVEGYTDVVACHQHGVRNVVATLGTALTKEHAHALRHFAEKVVLIFDADDAGQKAADRAVEVFIGGTLDVTIAVLPNRMDPDELLALPDGRQQWDGAIKDSRDALDYQFDRMKDQFTDNDTVAGRQRLTEEYLRKLAVQGLEKMSPIRRGLVYERLAHLVHLDEKTIGQMVSRLAQSNRPAPPKPKPQPTPQHPGGPEYLDVMDGDPALMDPDMPHPSDLAGSTSGQDATMQPSQAASGMIPKVRSRALSLAERQLLGCLLHRPELFSITLGNGHAFEEAIIPGDMTSDSANALYHVVYERITAGDKLRLSSLLMELMETGRQDLANLLTQADADIEKLGLTEAEQLEAVFRQAAAKLLETRQMDEKQETRNMALSTDSAELQENLLRQLQEHHRANPSPVRIAGISRGKS
ncbi:MAG TPA: DNA primase [Phycisphaerales bacterium]|nr:DNA primase [Phycisphaerales bacterium]|tara:strand:- start:61819 stop:63852 length:2034 start_codon:yes stop_codon:yes gene_type:complete